MVIRIVCFFLGSWLLLLVSCRWQSGDAKGAYLAEYEQFITTFQAEYNSYTADEWAAADEQLSELAHEEYQVFLPQLSYSEKVIVNKWAILYFLARCRHIVHEKVQNDYSNDTQNLLESLHQIMDSTYTIYDGFDAEMRDMLLRYKSGEVRRHSKLGY